MGYMFAPLRRYFDFSGRSRRKEFWLWFLFVIVAYLVVMYIDVALGLGGTATSYSDGDLEGGVGAGFNMNGGVLTMVFALAILIPNLAVAVRRMHDQDKSGWMLLLGLIPLVNFYILYLYFQPGTVGPNRFGPDPKGGDEAKVFA